jgi:signal transduction histidine kinase
VAEATRSLPWAADSNPLQHVPAPDTLVRRIALASAGLDAQNAPMSLEPAPSAALTAGRPAAHGRARGQVAAFVQVFNLRTVALAFYLCLAMAASRSLGWLPEAPTLSDWGPELARYTRQTLITGLCILLMLAIVEAWLAGRPTHSAARQGAGQRHHLVLRTAAVIGGALIGAYLRHRVANWGIDTRRMDLGWLVSTTLLWSLLGGIGAAILMAVRGEQQAQAELLEAQVQHQQLQAQQLEARLQALTAQIEPHFLFNTLATVKRLYETTPERGREMMLRLTQYLRAALPGIRRNVTTLLDETAAVRSYLELLEMRMGPRLRFEILMPPELSRAQLPTLLLQTLVENAIKHGLGPLPEGGHICVRSRAEGQMLVLEVEDDGRGFVASGGSGVGLANIRARLAALHGVQAALELQAAQPRGVLARVRLPLQQAAVAAEAVAGDVAGQRSEWPLSQARSSS